MGHVTWSLDNRSSTALATACWRTGYSFWQTSTHCLVPYKEWKPLFSFDLSLRNFKPLRTIQVQILRNDLIHNRNKLLDKPNFFNYTYYLFWTRQNQVSYVTGLMVNLHLIGRTIDIHLIKESMCAFQWKEGAIEII